jgi:hypothetical protein
MEVTQARDKIILLVRGYAVIFNNIKETNVSLEKREYINTPVALREKCQ